MASFDQYLAAKKQKEMNIGNEHQKQGEQQNINLLQEGALQDPLQGHYDNQKEKGLGKDIEEEKASFSYLQENLRLREANSTFEERTAYYFKDTLYMEAKEIRYRVLAEDNEGEIEAFAQRHTNRSAKKRKKKARAAADSFQKAKQLENVLLASEQGTLPAEDVYAMRNEIMRARMDGMINAAKVKATSKQDEKYRIAKAKLSCLTTLYEQAERLRAFRSEYFDRIQKKLEKELESVKKDLRKYSQDPDARWIEQHHLNDTGMLEQKLQESGNPYARIEDVKMSILFNQMSREQFRDEYKKTAAKVEENKLFTIESASNDELIQPTCVIRRNPDELPINKEEVRKEQWNQKWLEACKDPAKLQERKKLFIQSFERIKRMEIPSPREIKKKGIHELIKKDPAGMYAIMQFNLRVNNVRHVDPIVSEYIQFDKVLRMKLGAMTFLNVIIKNELNLGFNLEGNDFYNLQNGEKYTSPADRRTELEEAQIENRKMFEAYEKMYAKLSEARQEEKEQEKQLRNSKPLTRDQAMKQAGELNATAFTDESYQVYQELQQINRRLECPAYQTILAGLKNKLGENKRDLSRMLRPVHFTEKWEPVSDEDMVAHEWNIKVLTKLSIYDNGPILEGEPEYQLEEAKKMVQAGRMTQEDFEKLDAYKKYTEMERKKETELQDTVKEELLNTLTGKDFLLPDLQAIQKEDVNSWFSKKKEELKSEMMENIRNNLGTFMRVRSRVLINEETMKSILGETIYNENKDVIGAYKVAFNAFTELVDLYFWKKWGIWMDTEGPAKIMPAGQPDDHLWAFPTDTLAAGGAILLYKTWYGSYLRTCKRIQNP